MLTALAIADAKTATDTDAIRAAIRKASTTYKGLTGDMTMDDKGIRIKQDYGYFIFKDGKLQPFTP
jgi:ABC-type branched-subunit amino acid transport system substrate-binding protein